jgi:predicted ester cyclase
MSLEENKELVRRFVAAGWSAAGLNPDALDEIVAPDFTDHSASPDLTPGLVAYKLFVKSWHSSFSNMTHTTLHLLAEGDKVVEHWSATAKHTGEFMGIPATNKEGGTQGISTYLIENGKIKIRWGNADDLGMMRSLGVIP